MVKLGDKYIGVILRIWSYKRLELSTVKSLMGQQSPHLGDGIQGIPALLQDHRAGVIEEADQARDQAAQVAGIVRLRAGTINVEDDGSGLPHAHFRAAGGFQQILDDDPVPNVIFY